MKTAKINVKEVAIFGVIAALMFTTKKIMEVLPNIHLLGVFVVSTTVVYRKKALYPIYTYIFLEGLISGFNLWWLPYLYIWTFLWGLVMLLPRGINKKCSCVVYMTVCALHGFLFGILYAPAQAFFFGLDFKGTISWVVAGLPFDLIHGASNFICGLLICPVIKVLEFARASKA